MSESKLLLKRIREDQQSWVSLRPLSHSLPKTTLPVFLKAEGATSHQPIDPFIFKLEEWINTPWKGVRCLGISLSEKEVVVICDVAEPIKMESQEHGPWSEYLVMDKGLLYEHTTGEHYSPGRGVYQQPAGVVHQPEFLKPSRCIITWTRD